MSKAHHTKMASAINGAIAVDVTAGVSLLEIASALVNGLGFIAAYEADGNPAVQAATLHTMSQAIEKMARQRAAEIAALAAEDTAHATAVKP